MVVQRAEMLADLMVQDLVVVRVVVKVE